MSSKIDVCKTELFENFKSMDEQSVEALEKEIARLQDFYKKDAKAANKEMREVIDRFIQNEKYSSIRVIENKIKFEKLRRSIIQGDFKQSWRNFLDIYEGKNSIENVYKGNMARYSNMKISLMTKKGVFEDFNTGNFDEAIMIENANRAAGKPKGNNQKVNDMLDSIKEVNDVIYADMRAAGLNVGYRKDFLFGRNYNAEKLGKLSSKEWAEDMLDNYIDRAATFGQSRQTRAEQIQILEEIHESILTYQNAYAPNELVGKSNVFNKLKSRKLEFKDGKAEFEVHTKYGTGKRLSEAIDYQIDRSSKTVANTSMLGTDPEQVHKKLLNEFNNQFAKQVGKVEMDKNLSKVNRAYNEVVAPAHSPTTMLDRSINMIRGLQSLKLGGSALAAMWDTNQAALLYAIRTNGNMFAAYGKSIKNFVSVLSDSQKNEMARLANVHVNFIDPAIAAGAHAGDFETGFQLINKGFSAFQKLTGVPWQTKISRITNGINMTRAFSSMVDNIGKLTEFQKLSMKDFGITPDDLMLIKNHMKKNDLIDAYSPIEIFDIDGAVFDPNPIRAQKMKQELYNKYAAYVSDGVNQGTPTPNARVKRHLGKDRGNSPTQRAFNSLIFQFKETAWRITLSNKDALERYYQANGTKGAGMGMFQYGMLGMTSYMAFETLRAELLNKKTPWEIMQSGSDEERRNMMFDFLSKSSMGMMVSDAVDQGTSPYVNRDITKFVAGPTFGGLLPDFMQMFRSRRKGKAAKRFINRHVLPSNWLPYKAARNHALRYDIITGDKIRKK